LKTVGDETEVQVSESMEGVLAWRLSKLFHKILAKDMAKSFEFLKKACENQIYQEVPEFALSKQSVLP